MAGTITWEEFMKYASQIVEISDRIGDGWTLEGNKNDIGGAYLRKCTMKETEISVPVELSEMEEPPDSSLYDDTSTAEINRGTDSLIWEYHVMYQQSYGVPVVVFNVCSISGQPLTYDQMCKQLHAQIKHHLKSDSWNIVSQMEHPILMEPYFYLHPCQTADLMSNFKSISWNPVITWLSIIGPLVQLDMNKAYSCNDLYR